MDHHQQKNNRNNIAFVLGNGRSRLNADLEILKTHGTVFGCNALYREFDPDYLIAVDVKMINEIVAAGYHKKNSVWTNPNKGVATKHYINFFNPHRGWSSGPTALWMATQKGFKEIYILGFDYQGINGKFNNVYADSFNYKKSSDSATFHGNWLSQTSRIIKDNPTIRFSRLVEPSGFIPDQLKNYPNLKHIEYDQLHQIFPKKDS